MVRFYRKTQEIKRSILYYLGQFYTVEHIAQVRSISVKTVYYHIQNLIKEGYLTEEKDLTSKAKQSLDTNSLSPQSLENRLGVAPNDFRWHNVRVRIPIVVKGKDWVAHRHGIAVLKDVAVQTIAMGNFTTEQIVVDKVKIWVNPNAVILFMLMQIGKDQDAMMRDFLDALKRVVGKVEGYFGIRLYTGKVLHFEITKQHWALVKNEIARAYNQQKKKLFVYDNDGRLRFVVDDSLSMDEFEAVDAIKSPQDSQYARKHLLDWAEYDPPTNSELASASKQNAEQLAQLAQQLGAYAVHLQAHVDSVQKLGAGVEELVKVIKELKGVKE